MFDVAAKQPKALRSVQEKFYMNDYLESNENFEKAKQKARDPVHLLIWGSFSLTMFARKFVEAVAHLNRNTEDKELKVN